MKLSPVDTLNQMPIKSKAFADQVFISIKHLGEAGVQRLVTSKCAGQYGKTKWWARGF